MTKKDIAAGVLTQGAIEEAAIKAASNFGKSNHIIYPTFPPMRQHELLGTQWEWSFVLSPSEQAMAGLYITLHRLGILNKLSESSRCEIVAMAARKWGYKYV